MCFVFFGISEVYSAFVFGQYLQLSILGFWNDVAAEKLVAFSVEGIVDRVEFENAFAT